MRAQLADLLARSDAEPELAVSLPPACYRDPEVQDDELAQLFRNGWIGLGRSDIAAEPGSYAAMEIAADSRIFGLTTDSLYSYLSF